jgi:hypothetical protein
VKPRAPLGADLVIPALALGFAAYFFISIADLAWEAKAVGMMTGAILVILVALQLARIGWRLKKSEASLSTAPLWQPADVMGKRLGMVGVAAAFIATLPWLGLTLGLFLGMLAALRVMGVRGRATLVLLPLAIAAAAYLLFIVVLQSDFPHGPIEKLLS